jgi:hypothetical protein
MTETTSFPKSKIKILLLENIHPAAVAALKEQNFSVFATVTLYSSTQIEALKEALSEDELAEKIKGVHALGIRFFTYNVLPYTMTEARQESLKKYYKTQTGYYALPAFV